MGTQRDSTNNYLPLMSNTVSFQLILFDVWAISGSNIIVSAFSVFASVKYLHTKITVY